MIQLLLLYFNRYINFQCIVEKRQYETCELKYFVPIG